MLLLLGEILLLVAITIVVLQFFLRTEETHPLFKSLIPGKDEIPEDYLKVNRSNLNILGFIALVNRPLMPSRLREKITGDLSIAKIRFSAEEFMLIQEALITLLLFVLIPLAQPRYLPMAVLACVVGGYFVPRFWLSMKTSKIKQEFTKALPDTIDLLTLCVNAGLDFMLALKWVVEKSQPSILITELKILMQEISIGKSRRAALQSLAQKYRIPDVSSFTRSLIQADRMGTSVSQALEILSEDMRRSRFARGEQQALKAPIKLLFPLLAFIFPVVGIVIAGPILLQFMGTKSMFVGVGG
jgi:tight adherence protein C